MPKRVSPLLLVSLCLAGPVAAQDAAPIPLEEPLPIKALIRQDAGEVVPIEVELPPGESQSLDLGNYVLELIAPIDDLGFGTARLLQRQDGELLPLHTLREPWRDEGWPTLGYLICEGQVSFLLPRNGELPSCAGRTGVGGS